MRSFEEPGDRRGADWAPTQDRQGAATSTDSQGAMLVPCIRQCSMTLVRPLKAFRDASEERGLMTRLLLDMFVSCDREAREYGRSLLSSELEG